VAKAKNVCQVCLLDLDYNLPVQVRDRALGMEGEGLPESAAGREFALQRMEASGELERGQFAAGGGAAEALGRLARRDPYYKRNEARVCSFFARGACTRGAECPYRHEMATSGPLSQQNIRDRYYGTNDPVANKILQKAEGRAASMAPPEDRTICTLWVGGVGPGVSEEDVKDFFYVHGELRSVKKLDARSCAFVTFASREAAERAAAAVGGRAAIKGEAVNVRWGKPSAPREGGAGGGGGDGAGPSGGGAAAAPYPSMNPEQAGSRAPGAPAAEKRPRNGSGRWPPAADEAGKRPRAEPPAAAAAAAAADA
jgi:pre-mRNA-splicing factor RBM22/SLT11